MLLEAHQRVYLQKKIDRQAGFTRLLVAGVLNDIVEQGTTILE